MPPGTRSNSDRNEDPGNIVNNVISFLKSDDFTEIVGKVVSNETKYLQAQIAELKNEMQILRKSNMELIALLTNENYKGNKPVTKKTECPNVLKSVSYADKVISTADDQQKVSHQKMIFSTQKVPGTGKNITANNILETSSRFTQDVESETVNIDTSKTEGWSNVVKQKRRRNNKFITGSSNNSQIKTIPRKSFLFVSRIDPETDEKILKSHLVQFFKEAEVDELTSSYPEIYKSFKVSIDQLNFDAALDPSKWPSGAYVTKFFRPRRLVQPQK